MRAEDQVDRRAGPFQLMCLAVAALVEVVTGRHPFRAHVEQVDEEVVRQLLGLLGEDAVLGAAGVRTEHPQTAHKNGHLRSGQRQQLRAVYQGFLRPHELRLAGIDVVAEAIGARLERSKGGGIGLLL